MPNNALFTCRLYVTNLNLSPSISGNPITSETTANSVCLTHRLQKATMKTLAGSKRKTGTPFASPTKAAASTKRSRTQYDYYDEEDSESLSEYQWSADDTDSGSEMSVDGDEDQMHQPDSRSDKYASGPHGSRPLQDSRGTEVMPTVKLTRNAFRFNNAGR